MKAKTATVHSSEQVFATKWFAVNKDNVTIPSGKTIDHYVISFREACSILAINDDNQILLIRQYRYPTNGYLWELPAGCANPRETLEQCALR